MVYDNKFEKIETVNLLFHAALEFVAHNANKMQNTCHLIPNVQKGTRAYSCDLLPMDIEKEKWLCKSFLDSLGENNDYNVKTRKAENYLGQPAS